MPEPKSSTKSKSKRKTARQKLETTHPSHGTAFAILGNMQKSLGRGTMIVPRPLDVEAVMRLPREGQLLTMGRMRARLARDAGADHCCPLTAGIFARLAAEAAEEDAAAAKKAGKSTKARITPYWHTIRDDGKLNDKFPGGVKAQATKLRREGFKIQPGKGKQPPRVDGFEEHLIDLSR